MMNGAMDEGDASHVEEVVPIIVDATIEADNVTYIRGKGDIGVVNFTKVCDADDMKKFRFADNELAYAFYNTYGLVVGLFSVRKRKMRRNESGIVVRLYFSCSCEGYRNPDFFERMNQRRQPKVITRFGCGGM
ncbi:hypothetical protein RIF29_03446 [Crotalaria pallida]|uniref:FAR1 domain-containing protein n=1 Tax=Crotalaria pallida TaxID=3830 RepID=A0AAN9IZY7_CROPI